MKILEPFDEQLADVCKQLEKLGCTRTQTVFDNGLYSANTEKVPLITSWLNRTSWRSQGGWWYHPVHMLRLRLSTLPRSSFSEVLVTHV